MSKLVVTQELIEKINELYLEIKTYAGVSRALGGSPSSTTVKKYIIPNYVPQEKLEVKKFDRKLVPPFEEVLNMFKGLDNYGALCTLSEIEEIEIEELWEELLV